MSTLRSILKVRRVIVMGPSLLLSSYDIIDAAYRFYRSRCEEESAKRRGKLQEKNKQKRKHERIVRVSTKIIL